MEESQKNPHFVEVIIESRTRETAESFTLGLRADPPLQYLPGQFLTFIFHDLHPAGEIRRSYSFSSTPGVDPFPSITIKAVPNGLVSRYLRKIDIGSKHLTLPPGGSTIYEAEPQKPRDIFLIAAGSGITPLYSILKAALYKESKSFIHLYYGNSSPEQTIFLDNLLQLHKHCPHRFRGRYFFSSGPVKTMEHDLSSIKVSQGRMSNEVIGKAVSEDALHPLSESSIYICAPRGLRIKAEMALRTIGVQGPQLHKEIFTLTTPFAPDPASLLPSTVKLKKNGESFTISAQPGDTVLRAAERKSRDLIPYSCRSGVCTTCKGTLLSGEVEMYGQSGKVVPEPGESILTCVSYPISDEVEIDI